MKRAFLLTLLLLACPAIAGADETFVYTKTVLKIVPRPGSQRTPAPAEAKDAAKDIKKGDTPLFDTAESLMPVIKRAPKEYTVEVRTRAFLDQTDFIEHQPFADREGMLILIDPPAEAAVKSTQMIAQADLLFVDADGVIVKIAPELALAALTEPVESGKPIHAFLFLKSGAAAHDDILLGDRIENSNFKTHPVVIEQDLPK